MHGWRMRSARKGSTRCWVLRGDGSVGRRPRFSLLAATPPTPTPAVPLFVRRRRRPHPPPTTTFQNRDPLGITPLLLQPRIGSTHTASAAQTKTTTRRTERENRSSHTLVRQNGHHRRVGAAGEVHGGPEGREWRAYEQEVSPGARCGSIARMRTRRDRSIEGPPPPSLPRCCHFKCPAR